MSGTGQAASDGSDVAWNAAATYILAAEHPVGHRDAWEALLAARQRYPRDVYVRPWERPLKGAGHWQPLAVAALATSGRHKNSTLPERFTIYQPAHQWTLELGGDATEPEQIARQLFTRRYRGTLIVFLHGQRRELHAILRWFARPWVDLGYRLIPLSAGNKVRAIIVTRQKQKWLLCDVEAMTGLDPADVERDLLRRDKTVRQLRNYLPALYVWLGELQRVTLRELGTALRPTAGGTALAAASQHLPEGQRMWRQEPGLVALCRVAGALRGGYVAGNYYRGLAYKADVRRMYTACLRYYLPAAYAFGRGVLDGDEQLGVFLCTVRGKPRIPPYLTVWDPVTEAFWTGHWKGGECVAALPDTEYPGLRALGLDVEPGWGYVATATFTLETYVAALQRICATEGVDSAAGQLTKWLGNTLTGKWGVKPERESIVYSADPPAADAFPAITLEGAEIPACWFVREDVYGGYQQPALAAIITGRARSVLYQGMVDVLDRGELVISAHTDGYVATGTPPDTLKLDETMLGAWRLVGTDTRAIVAGAGRYVVGREVRLAGATERSRRLVELAYEAGRWTVSGELVAAPEPAHP